MAGPRRRGRALGASLLVAGLIIAGLVFGTVSLFVPGVALIVLAVGAAGWVALAAKGAHVTRLPGPHTVEEEQPYPLRLQLRQGVLPPPTGLLADPLLDTPAQLGGRAPDRLRIDVRFARRGRRRIEPGSLSISDPLGIASRSIAVDGDHAELVVLPRTEQLRAEPGSGGADGSGIGVDGAGRALTRGRADGSAAELDLDGLRPYRRGTPASRIHWPAVARGGEMVERRLSADADSAPLVILDASSPPSEQALDAAVRAAASICLAVARRGRCACLVPGDRRPTLVARDLAAWPALHARLAVVEAMHARPAPATVQRAGTVIWVGARPDGPRALARAPGGAWLVTPATDVATRAAFTVAGCQARRVGRGAGASSREAVA